ncbi:MAG: hypothetical protein ABSG64_12680 [Solirubrobacteraceae bacterium]
MSVPARLRIACAAAAVALVVGTSLAYAARVAFKSGTYSGTVTAQDYGVSPFPVSLTVVGKKYATTKKITKLEIGPIQMTCLSNVGSVDEAVTIPVLSGFPTIKSHGFLQATFLYTSAGWTKASFDTNQTADSEITFRMVSDLKPAAFVSNGGSEPGMSMIIKADVSGTTATPAANGTSTCNIDNSDPTLKLG